MKIILEHLEATVIIATIAGIHLVNMGIADKVKFRPDGFFTSFVVLNALPKIRRCPSYNCRRRRSVCDAKHRCPQRVRRQRMRGRRKDQDIIASVVGILFADIVRDEAFFIRVTCS